MRLPNNFGSVSRKETLSALTKYNKNPYGLTNKTINFEEVYLKCPDKKFE